VALWRYCSENKMRSGSSLNFFPSLPAKSETSTHSNRRRYAHRLVRLPIRVPPIARDRDPLPILCFACILKLRAVGGLKEDP
jgi:hypothetical protein